jgi:hypothetical protein
MQQAGRAGRDGQRADVIVFPSSVEHSKCDDVTFREFLETTSCRRYVLQETLDDNPSTCDSLIDAHRCDNCSDPLVLAFSDIKLSVSQKVDVQMPSRVDTWRRKQLSDVVKALYINIRILQTSCHQCLFTGSQHRCNCPEISMQDRALIRACLSSAQTRHRIPGLHTCFYCHLPQMKSISPAIELHDLKVTDGAHCLRAHNLIPIVHSIIRYNRIPAVVAEKFHATPAENLFDILLQPVSHYPCDDFDIGQQLCVLHFVLAACLYNTSLSHETESLLQQDWFQPWLPKPNLEVHVDISETLTRCFQDYQNSSLHTRSPKLSGSSSLVVRSAASDSSARYTPYPNTHRRVRLSDAVTIPHMT